MKATVFTVLLFTAVALAQTAPAPKHANDSQGPRQEQLGPEQVLLKADRAFCQATAQHRLEGWMQYMADDAVLFSARPVVGKAAIREFETPAFADPEFQLQWQPAHAEMFPSGDMGYTVGRYELHANNAKGEPVVRRGTYLTVWRKQADGSWKVVADGGSADKPAVSH
jgi:ketosteroid isomerase-like protein